LFNNRKSLKLIFQRVFTINIILLALLIKIKKLKMKSLNITKRDVKVFLLGVLVVIAIDTIINWPDAYVSFMKGFNDAKTETSK